MESSTHYFGAGPAALPADVKQQVQKDVLQYSGTPVSILELSHRSEEFLTILNRSRVLLRSLYAIPENYQILFMHGGASSQFDAVPLNILGSSRHATYINTGLWSRKASQLARKYAEIELIEGLQEKGNLISCIDSRQWMRNKKSAYVHVTPNETVDGIELDDIAGLNVPVVADMTSCLLMKDIDVSQYAVIYAGTQKTMGIAGLTIVIVRDDMLDQASPVTPDMFRYDLHAKENSIVNTSPVFACYVAQLMLEWVKQHGGISEMVTLANQRSKLLYDVIGESTKLLNNIDPQYRSSINVVFDAVDNNVIDSIINKSLEQGLTGLAGHRLVGGIRASMYNGTPIEAVTKLQKIIQEIT